MTELMGRVASAVALVAIGAMVGAGVVLKQWRAEERSEEKVATVAQAGQEVVLQQVITHYVDRFKTITLQGETKIKEVPIYVTAQNDAACTINAGFVRLWNAANAGATISPDPSGADAAPSGVSLSDAEAQHIREATYTRQLEEQLMGLQDAIQGVRDVAAAAAKK